MVCCTHRTVLGKLLSMQRRFDFEVDEFYHLYNRGTDKRKIFETPADYARFTALLYLCNSKVSIVFRDLSPKDFFSMDRGETLVDIGVYCLMPNHFHILIREKLENGTSAFMKKLLTSYSMYFNRKNNRTGGLFEGTYKARHADTDRYLKYLFSYIHLNPAKRVDTNWKTNIHIDRKKILDYINRYPHSSFLDYKGVKRKEGAILNTSAFPDYFENTHDLEQSIADWLHYDDELPKDGPM